MRVISFVSAAALAFACLASACSPRDSSSQPTAPGAATGTTPMPPASAASR
jgi:hypothetical protein